MKPVRPHVVVCGVFLSLAPPPALARTRLGGRALDTTCAGSPLGIFAPGAVTPLYVSVGYSVSLRAPNAPGQPPRTSVGTLGCVREWPESTLSVGPLQSVLARRLLSCGCPIPLQESGGLLSQ